MIRVFWATAGVLAVIFGMIGAVMPLLPTVPFLLLAAFCFARSSERLHAWLLQHPRLGPPIREWQQRGAISRRAKWLAIGSILATFGISVIIGLRPLILLIQGLTLTGVALFIWTRPER